MDSPLYVIQTELERIDFADFNRFYLHHLWKDFDETLYQIKSWYNLFTCQRTVRYTLYKRS